MWNKLKRIFKHRWLDESAPRRVLPPDLLQRLTRRVSASERRHTGEVRICVEAGLPLSYLWRGASARERAVMLFGKLGVWDTEHNNGVLIYLLLADHAIEFVADRGLNAVVSAEQWKSMVTRLSAALGEERFEDGLTQALEEVSQVLVEHFPLAPGISRRDELPNQPLLF
jgi:TPM domain